MCSALWKILWNLVQPSTSSQPRCVKVLRISTTVFLKTLMDIAVPDRAKFTSYRINLNNPGHRDDYH